MTALNVRLNRSDAMKTSTQTQGTPLLELKGHRVQLLGAAHRSVLAVQRPQPQAQAQREHARYTGTDGQEAGRGPLANVNARTACRLSVNNIDGVPEIFERQRLGQIKEAQKVRELQRLLGAAVAARRPQHHQGQRQRHAQRSPPAATADEQFSAVLKHGASLYHQLFQRHYERLEKRARGELYSDTEEDCR